jgi:hypothetical protein
VSTSQPWCPVCRLQVGALPRYQPPNGFSEVFEDHGCDGDGRKVGDADYGFVNESGATVPPWEYLGTAGKDRST